MNHSMINALVSMQGLQQKLDVIGHNLSNLNTAGYKRKEATFHDVLTSVMRQEEETAQLPGRLTPPGFVQGRGAIISQIQTVMEQGSLQETGLPYDLAIEGNALFELRVPAVDENGQAVQRSAWTRDGSFALTVISGDPDNVYLTSKDGYPVMSEDGEPIRIPAGYKLRIDADGKVSAYLEADPHGSAVEAGRLRLVQIVRPQLLSEWGNNLYMLQTGADPDAAIRPLDWNAENPDTAKIAVRQGFLEQSNVDLTSEMAELLTTQRAFQMNARALASADTLMQLTNSLRG
jgi:flagellar basal-body rod protein FlgG